jgi:hypothetical protein
MNKQYIVSVIGVIACLGVIGTLIPSLIPMPAQAQVDCNETPFAPQCLQTNPDKIIVIPPGECLSCLFGNILDYKKFLTIDEDWNATVNFKHNPNSVTLSVNIPNVLIDAIGPKQENFTMTK